MLWKHFVKVCETARDNGVDVKAYVLLKPPYLGEKEAIEDAVQSAIDAAPYVDKISINPVNVQKNTVVEKLWFRNEWTAPWLWSVIEVLERYRIPRDQWHQDTVGGLAVVTFVSLIGQVDDEARGAVLQIPSPDIISTNSALRQVLVKRQSGLKMLNRWSA